MNNHEYRLSLVTDYLQQIKLESKIKDFFEGKTILITGGAGAIGSNLVIALSNLVGKNGIIIVIDNLSAIKGNEPLDMPPLENMMFIKGDVRNDTDLKEFLERNRQLYIIYQPFLLIKIQ